MIWVTVLVPTALIVLTVAAFITLVRAAKRQAEEAPKPPRERIHHSYVNWAPTGRGRRI